MRVAEYARQFSALLVYVPHVANQKRTKRNKFLKGLRPDLYRMVLSGSPATYIDVVNRAVDIEESLMEVEAPIHPTTECTYQPVQDASQSFYLLRGPAAVELPTHLSACAGCVTIFLFSSGVAAAVELPTV
ncbi:hypothetical protein F511_02087 [Dorcoceras hygrometricum]|nr:hypothetical protein F511_02087 [Dorcoceras hygrometricum]